MGNWTRSVLGLTLVAGLATAAFRPRHRLAVISAMVSAAAGLLIMLAHGPWMLLPAWLWGGLTGTTLVLGVVAARGYRPYRRCRTGVAGGRGSRWVPLC